MKIISKFKDYYDNMRCYANPAFCSDDFTYKRKTEEFTIPQEILCFILNHEGGNNNGEIIRHIIGFCGEWYFMYSIKTSNNFYNPENAHLNYTFFTHVKDVLVYNWNMKYIKKCFNSNNWGCNNIFQKNKKATFDKTIDKVLELYTKYEYDTLKEYSIYLNKLNLFEKYNTPTIEVKEFNAWREATVVINPNLEKLSFYKMMEGNIAYQELEMYLGNELLPQDNAAQITDSLVLAANHGFNKASFRKPPSKAYKRANRKANKEKKRHANT